MHSDIKLAAVRRHLLRPLQGGAAGVVIVFSILLGVCAKSLFGLPLALILISWFFKYAFILFDSILRGFDEPPVLDIKMMNPLGELRPIAALLIVGGMAVIAWAGYGYGGPLLALTLATMCLLLLPASIAVLGLESNVLQAINPYVWFQIIRQLGAYYWFTLGLIAAEFAAVYLVGELPLGIILQFAAGMFGMLSAFSLLAGALYERRDEIGLFAWHSPERNDEKQRQEEHRKDEEVVTDAYGLMRTTRHQDCWKMLQTWLEAQNFTTEAYRWLTGRTDRWEDPRYSTRLAQDWIERLVAQKQPGQALAVVKDRLQHDPAFRPKSATDTVNLAHLASLGGGSPRTARTLLSDFPQRFPNHPLLAAADELTQHLS